MRHQAITVAAATTTAGLALAACSAASTGAGGRAGGTAVAGTGAPPSAGPAGATAPSEPKTAAAAWADADGYLTLQAAGQFAVTYQMLSASARRAISEGTWVAVHRSCPGLTARIGYQIQHVVLAGKTAAVTVALPAAPKPGTHTETLVYSGGHWGLSPADLSLYRHGSVAADVAAVKASGRCPG